MSFHSHYSFTLKVIMALRNEIDLKKPLKHQLPASYKPKRHIDIHSVIHCYGMLFIWFCTPAALQIFVHTLNF